MLVMCLLVARASPHAYVAACGVGCIVAIGCLFPLLLGRLPRVQLHSLQERVTAGEVVRCRVDTFQPLPISLPGFSIQIQERSTPQRLAMRGRRASERIEFTPTRRGEIKLSDATVLTSFPFGLINVRVRAVTGGTVLVWPTKIETDLPRLDTLATRVPLDAMTHLSDTGDFAGVRTYRRGDSIRSVHWRQTARQNQLIVRERAAGEHQLLNLTLDTDPEAYVDDAHFDRAVGTVVGLLDSARAARLTVMLDLAGDRIVISTDHDRPAAMDALARVKRETPIADPHSGIFVTGRAGKASRGVTFVEVRPA